MQLVHLIAAFANDEDGAVTVDWVVLTAAICGLAIAVYAVISGGIEDLSNDIDAELRKDIVGIGFSSTSGG